MERAQAVVQAAIAEANKRGWPMNVTVVDPNGDLIAFGRMDGAQLASIPISQHKARHRRAISPSDAGVRGCGAKFGFNYILTLDDVIASRGGIPLVEGGKIIGAIGCSGGTGSQDEAICTAASGLDQQIAGDGAARAATGLEKHEGGSDAALVAS